MQVEIADVISPNCFIVRPLRCQPLTFEVSEVMRIETLLVEWADDPNGKIDEGNVHKLGKNEIVSVQVEGSWLRAEVQELLCRDLKSAIPRHMLVNVFLIDWGFQLKITDIVKDIRLLPEDSDIKKVFGLAKKVEVNVLVALERVFNSLCQSDLEPSINWSLKAFNFVNHLCIDAVEIFLYNQRSKSENTLVAEDVLFVLPEYESEGRALEVRYGDFKPNYDKCSKEGCVSLVKLLVSGNFARVIDPLHNPIKKQLQTRTLQLSMISANARVSDEPKRYIVQAVDDDLPKRPAENERPKLPFGQLTVKSARSRQKENDFSIQDLVDKEDRQEPPLDLSRENFQTKPIGRGDAKKVRTEKSTEKKLPIKRGRAHVQHVVEDGQFSDIDAGCPFWESDEKKFSKSSNVWKSSENKNLRVPKKHNVIPGGLDIGSWQREEHKYQNSAQPAKTTFPSSSKSMSVERVFNPQQKLMISSNNAVISADDATILRKNDVAISNETMLQSHPEQSTKKLSRSDLLQRYNRATEDQKVSTSTSLTDPFLGQRHHLQQQNLAARNLPKDPLKSFRPLVTSSEKQGPNSDEESNSSTSSSKFYSANENLTKLSSVNNDVTSQLGHISFTSPLHTRPTGSVPKVEATLSRRQYQTSFRDLLMGRVKSQEKTSQSEESETWSSFKNAESLPVSVKLQIQSPSSGFSKSPPYLQESLKEASLDGTIFRRKKDELSQRLPETGLNQNESDLDKETSLSRKSLSRKKPSLNQQSSSGLVASSSNDEDWSSMSEDSLELPSQPNLTGGSGKILVDPSSSGSKSDESKPLSRKDLILLSLRNPERSRDQSSTNQMLSSVNDISRDDERLLIGPQQKDSAKNVDAKQPKQIRMDHRSYLLQNVPTEDTTSSNDVLVNAPIKSATLNQISCDVNPQNRIKMDNRAYLLENVPKEDLSTNDVLVNVPTKSLTVNKNSLDAEPQSRIKMGHRSYLEQSVYRVETSSKDAALLNKSGSETSDMALHSRFSVQSSESEGEKRVRRRGIDYTVVHKDAGVYTKTDVSNLATVFHPRIMSNIRWIKSPLAAQSHIWPIIKSCFSVASVQDKGKTTSYALPLTHLIVCGSGDCPATKSEAPPAIVLCPSWSVVEKVAQIFNEVGRGCIIEDGPEKGRDFEVTAIYENEKERAIDLINGCHVMVTTPPSLLRMLRGEEPLTSLSRCSHLVLEEADELFSGHWSEIQLIMNLVRAANKKNKIDTQKIVIAKEWNLTYKTFIDKFMRPPTKVGPFIVISRCLEAALYGRIKTEAIIVENEDEKLEKTLKIIVEQSAASVILCNDEESTIKLSSFLESNCPHVFAIHEGIDAMAANRILLDWRGQVVDGHKPPLILSDNFAAADDFTFPSLSLRNEILIHFDLPVKSRATFGYRYFHLDKKHCFKSYYKPEKIAFETKPVQSFVLIQRAKNAAQIETIRYFIERSSGLHKISDSLNDLCKQQKILTEAEGTGFCDQLKTFGSCRRKFLDVGGQNIEQSRSCRQRHFLIPEMDIDASIVGPQSSGLEVTFYTKLILSPTYYLVQLSEVKDAKLGTIVHNFRKSYLCLGFELGKLKIDKLESEVLSSNLVAQLNKVFLLKNKKGVLTRGQLYKIPDSNNKADNNPQVSFLLIDEGEIVTKQKNNFVLWKLPEHLTEEKFPRHLAEVAIVNLRPKDKDLKWSRVAERCIKSALVDTKLDIDNNIDSFDETCDASSDELSFEMSDSEESLHLNKEEDKAETKEETKMTICRSKILATIGNTLIVSQVQLLERLQSVSANKNKWSPIFDVRNTLLEKFGDQNPEHVLNLVTLLEESNIPAEKFEALSNHARCLNSTRISGTDFPVDLNKKMLTSYRRAFFDLDNAYIDVFITEVYSPAKIFVRHEKFDKLLKTLEDDLCNYWSTVKESSNPSDLAFNQMVICREVQDYEGYDDQDDFVLQHFYYRAQILEISTREDLELEEEELVYRVHLIDYGIVKEVWIQNLIPMPTHLIDQLPGQAIECRLSGIFPTDPESGWSVESGDFLFKVADYGQALFRASDIEKVSTGTSNASYSLQLEDLETNMSLHMQLVLEELAVLDNFDMIMEFASKPEPEMDSLNTPKIIETDLEIKQEITSESCTDIVNEATAATITSTSTSTTTTTTTRVESISEPRVPLWRPNFPETMPGCSVIETHISQIRQPLENLWCQDRQSLSIEFRMNLTFPAEQRNAYFSVQPDQLDFEYLDTIYNLNVREEFVLYRIPSLKLFSPVDPQKTEFKFLNTSIKVTLFKIRPIAWRHPSIDYKASCNVKYKSVAYMEESSDEESQDEIDCQLPIEWDKFKTPGATSNYPAPRPPSSTSELGSSGQDSESEERLSKLYMSRKNKPIVLGEKALDNDWEN